MGLPQHQITFHIINTFIMLFVQGSKWDTARSHIISGFNLPVGEIVTPVSRFTRGIGKMNEEVVLSDGTTEISTTFKPFHVNTYEIGIKGFAYNGMKNRVCDLSFIEIEEFTEQAHNVIINEINELPSIGIGIFAEQAHEIKNRASELPPCLHSIMNNKISKVIPHIVKIKKYCNHVRKVFVSFLKHLNPIKDTLNGILVFTSAENFHFAMIRKLVNCFSCFIILSVFSIFKKYFLFKKVRKANDDRSKRIELNGKHKHFELLPKKRPVFMGSLWNDMFTFFRDISWNSCDKPVDFISLNASVGETKKRQYMLDILYGLREVPDVSILTYPASLDKYFDDLKKTDVTKSDLMKYEWARYESFKKFPKTSLQTPMRLAQAGFYYSGLGEEVICFCCGKRNRSWNSNETALEVHKRISPDCSFVLGEENSNISIHASNPENEATSSIHESGAANGGPEDTQFGVLETMTNSEQTKFRESIGANIRQPTHSTYSTTKNNSAENGHVPQKHSKTTENPHHALENSDPNSSSNNAMQTHIPGHRSTGISFERAKHPEYSVKTVRISSYSGWASHYVQTPEELSKAGFYYAGFQDCVRCFYCGGGLKNWEYGESPWIEHARWYPNFDYLRQCKGEEFITQYREEEEVQKRDDTMGQQGNELASYPTGTVQRPGENVDTYYTRNGDMDSAAAESVKEMGYDTDTVKRAIEVYRTYYGNTKLTVEALMDILLNDTSNRTNNTRHENNPNPRANDNTQGRYTSDIERPGASKLKHPSDRNQGEVKIPDISQMKITDSQNRSTNVISEKSQETDPNGKRQSVKTDRKALLEENRSLREQMMCKICMDSDACIVFLPCGHMVACAECAPALRKCAICRKLIKRTIRAFPS